MCNENFISLKKFLTIWKFRVLLHSGFYGATLEEDYEIYMNYLRDILKTLLL